MTSEHTVTREREVVDLSGISLRCKESAASMGDDAVAQGERRSADEGIEEISYREWTTAQITLCV